MQGRVGGGARVGVPDRGSVGTDNLSVSTASGFRELDEIFRDVLGRLESVRIFSRKRLGAHLGSHDAGIEQVDADIGLGNFYGVNLGQRFEGGLAGRISAPIR